jgi:diguanylate cyclase (GGDEF)-like protein
MSPLAFLHKSLQWRIVVFFAILLVIVQGVTLILVDVANSRTARATINEELAIGERIFRRQVEQNGRQLAQAAEILSLDFAFREAVATRDLETIRSALLNHGSRIQAHIAALVSPEGTFIADTRRPENAGRPFIFPGLITQAEKSGKATGIALVDGQAFQLVVVPVLAPTPIAWATFGFLMDDRVAKDLQTLTALHVSFLGRRGDGVWRVLASTMAADAQESLREAVARRSVADRQGMALEAGGHDYEALFFPLEQTGKSPVVAVLTRSLDEALTPFRRLGTLLMVLALGSLAASIAGSILIARGITRPVRALIDMTRRIEEGDYTRAVPVDAADEMGELARRFNLMRDGIAAREEQILRLAYRDVLTDLPNRVLFNDRLNVAIRFTKRVQGSLTVLLMDLNRFKAINDTLGHHVGDQVLQHTARRLSGMTRKSDTTARLGGDEFAVLLNDTTAEQAKEVAEKISRTLEEPIVIGQHSLDVRASIGVAAWPEHGADVETLMRHADAAMYSAKRTNADYAVYDASTHAQRQEELSLLSQLRRAVDAGELKLVYQPKVELATGKVAGVEALLRWVHPVRGEIPPVHFIPFAEQTGFIKTITRWVIDEAVRQATAWRAAGRSLKVAVNISAQDLLMPELPEIVMATLKAHQAPPDLLSLEITESGLMQDAARAIEVMKRLAAIGVGRAIDDFGTGYSSLAYIKQLPVDEIKIDRSFVRNIMNDKKDMAIVLATVELCHNLGLIVVAEGVEDTLSNELLRRIGCDLAQGYLFTPPLDAVALEAWLAARGDEASTRTAAA